MRAVTINSKFSLYGLNHMQSVEYVCKTSAGLSNGVLTYVPNTY